MTIEKLVDISTAAGAMATYIYEPTTDPEGVIILYMDAAGIRPALRAMADRMSDDRFIVLMPDLYHRLGRLVSFDTATARRDEAYLAEVIRHIRSVRIEDALSDAKDALAWLDMDRGDRLPAATIGYCMGGPFAFSAASRFPDRVKAAASIYGVGCMTDQPDSPHLGLPKIKAELYFAYAEKDEHAPISEVPVLEDALAEGDFCYEVEIYQGASHGFAFTDRATFDEAASEHHWKKILELFRRNLP